MTTKNVPLEPTEEMLDAALRLQGEDAFYAKAPALMSALVKIYTAMVKASPPSGGEVYQRLAQIAVYGDVWFDISRETYEATKESGITRVLHTSPRVVDEAMVLRAAKALCRNQSEVCCVNYEDNWKLDSQVFIDDARTALQAALELSR